MEIGREENSAWRLEFGKKAEKSCVLFLFNLIKLIRVIEGKNLWFKLKLEQVLVQKHKKLDLSENLGEKCAKISIKIMLKILDEK